MADKPASVTIDGTRYEVDTLSKEAKTILANLAAIEQELQRLRTRSAIARIAQQALAAQLKAQLPAAKP